MKAKYLVIWFLVFSNVMLAKDKGESPYFDIISGSSGAENLPLLSTSANVEIDGVIADLKITQVYINTGNSPIEAVYTFPASSRAAVYFMKMTIKDRVIISKITEKKEAERIYNEAKKEGKSASLLTESRPNVFTMNVANIMPGDTIAIEFKYTEILEPEEGIYEFVFPAVVGPRYRGNIEKSDPTPDVIYKDIKDKAIYKYDINIKINAGVPLSFLKCETHKIITKSINENVKEIKLEDDINNGNRDFVLQYKIQGENIQTGMILTENGDENFFLMMLQPPRRVNNADILPKEYIFLVDISGSQEGFPLDISKKLMAQVLDKLRTSDMFNIIVFSDSYRYIFSESEYATDDNIEKAKEYIKNLKTEGGTNILQALNYAMESQTHSGYSKIIAVLTDGFVENEIETFVYVNENLNKVNIFGFGIGTSVNRYYIDGLARVGMGESFFALNQSSADSLINEFIKYTDSPIMKDIKIDYGDFWASETFPEKIPDLFASRPIIVIGKWKKPMKGTILVKGKTPNEDLHANIYLDKFGELYTGEGLKYLWARKKVELYSDLATFSRGDEYKDEITDLGLKYSLLTKYTSFVAVDSEVRNQSGTMNTVNQPVPQPEGVSGSSYQYSSKSSVGSSIPTSSDLSGSYPDMENPLIPTYEAPPVYFGTVFGMSFFNMDNKFDYDNRALLSGELPAVNGHSYHYGLTFFDFFGEPISSYLNYTLSLTYNSNYLSASGSIINPAMNNRLLNFSGNEQDSLTTSLKYNNETEFSNLGLDFMLSYIIINNLSLNLDFGFQFIIKDKIVESLEITDPQSQLTFKEPENTQLENENKKLMFINEDIPNMNLFQMPVSLGINYDLLYLRSIFRFNYNLGTNLFNFQKDINNDYLFHRVRLFWIYAF
ncbi:MAG: VIT domain-containing protein [Candidatus Kapabacteria bacterium]|nr:VIT domain-containing protein [Candidatus Kapabacteria bacterium]